MNEERQLPQCHRCESVVHVKPKLLMIDELWADAPGKDSREKVHKDLRVDELKDKYRQDGPQGQFIEGYYCEHCEIGFVPDELVDKEKFHRNCCTRF